MPKALPTRERLIESARYLFWERRLCRNQHGRSAVSCRRQFGQLLPLLREQRGSTAGGATAVPFGAASDGCQSCLRAERGTGATYLRYSRGLPGAVQRRQIASMAVRWGSQLWKSIHSGAVRECLEELKERMPTGTDLDALATYVLAVMEGGVMLSRSYGSVEPFDRTINQLRQHFRLLLGSKRTNPE